MSSSHEFADYIAELLSSIGTILVRRMFSGHGVYCDGLFIAIVSRETLYFKTDVTTRAAFEQAGDALCFAPHAVLHVDLVLLVTRERQIESIEQTVAVHLLQFFAVVEVGGRVLFAGLQRPAAMDNPHMILRIH